MAARKRESTLRARTRLLLSRTVTVGTNAAPHELITIGDLDVSISHTGHSKYSSIERWVSGKSIPDSEDAWQVGEEFAAIGMPWMSGLTMLWICGHYEDFIGTIALLARAQQVGVSDIFGRYLDSLRTVTQPHPLDEIHDLFEIYLRSRGTNPKLNELPSLARASDQERIAFLRRENAKEYQIAFVDTFSNLLEVFEKWRPPVTFGSTKGRQKKEPRATLIERLPLDRLVSAAIDIARSPDLSVETTETAIYAILAQWAGMLYAHPWDIEIVERL